MNGLNILKKVHHSILFFGLLCLSRVGAQTPTSLSLSEAYKLTEANYPLAGNQPFLEQASDLRIQNLEKSKLPSVHWKTTGTLQSETTGFAGEGAPINIDLPLYNLRTYAEANYLLLDGGVNDARKRLEKLQLAVDEKSLEVDLNSLKEKVNSPFFAVLLLREQNDILDVTGKDLSLRRETLEAGVRHGTVLESEVDKIAVRQLEIKAEKEQVKSDELAMLSLLQNLTGRDLSPGVELALPELVDFTGEVSLERPEQELFQLQKQSLLANESLIEAGRKPTLNMFAETGIGYPNPLNFFDDGVAPYARGGLNFSWKIFDWGKAGRDQELLMVQSQMIDNQRETFEHNINILDGKYQVEMTRMHQQIARDGEIAQLQGKILRQLSSQLEQGVITVNDYLTQANAELRARQQLRLHEVQLQQLKVEYLTLHGAF